MDMARLSDDNSQHSSEKSSNVWVIVGASVAGVMVLLAAIFVVFLCIFRRKRSVEPVSRSSAPKTGASDLPQVSRMASAVTGSESKGIRRAESTGEDYFKQLLTATKVKSISDYKK